jgi:hypothetical protein
MFFFYNGWNVPHHILNDYYLKQFVCNDFKAIKFYFFMTTILIMNLIIYLKFSFSVLGPSSKFPCAHQQRKLLKRPSNYEWIMN